MRTKTKKISNWKLANNLLRINTPTLILFVVVYNLFYSFAVRNVGRFLWTVGLTLSPINYITNDNLLQLLISPLVLVAILVMGVGLACWTFFNIVAIVVCVQASVEGRRIRLHELLRESWGHVARSLRRENFPILLFAVLIIPFTHTIMTTNFISQLSIPEYINEVIQETPLYFYPFTLVVLLGIFVTVQYMFLFQFFVLDNCTFVEAARKSRRLIKGHRISSFLRLVWWRFRLFLTYSFFSLLLMLLFYLALYSLADDQQGILLAGGFAEEYIVTPALEFVITCVETFAQYVFIAVLFYRRLQAQQEGLPTQAETPHSGRARPSLEDRKAKVANRLFLPALLVGILVLGLGSSWVFAYVAGPDAMLDYAMSDLPVVTSHRGYSAVAPENTLPSFQAAIDSGSQYAELDVQQTKDGVVVVTHDTNLKRCTGVDVNIYDITWDELQELDAGSYFSAEFSGTRIPSLEQVIEQCKGKIKLNIEIKNNGHNPELEAETARVIRENGFADECVITSLSYDSLVKVKQTAPELKTGYILAIGVGNYYDLPAADFFSVETTFITQDMVKAIHKRGKEVHAWTVDTNNDADKMISLEVDNIITGKPEMVRERINAETQWYLTLLTLNGDFEDLDDFLSQDIYQRLEKFYEDSDEWTKADLNGVLEDA